MPVLSCRPPQRSAALAVVAFACLATVSEAGKVAIEKQVEKVQSKFGIPPQDSWDLTNPGLILSLTMSCTACHLGRVSLMESDKCLSNKALKGSIIGNCSKRVEASAAQAMGLKTPEELTAICNAMADVLSPSLRAEYKAGKDLMNFCVKSKACPEALNALMEATIRKEKDSRTEKAISDVEDLEQSVSDLVDKKTKAMDKSRRKASKDDRLSDAAIGDEETLKKLRERRKKETVDKEKETNQRLKDSLKNMDTFKKLKEMKQNLEGKVDGVEAKELQKMKESHIDKGSIKKEFDQMKAKTQHETRREVEDLADKMDKMNEMMLKLKKLKPPDTGGPVDPEMARLRQMTDTLEKMRTNLKGMRKAKGSTGRKRPKDEDDEDEDKDKEDEDEEEL